MDDTHIIEQAIEHGIKDFFALTRQAIPAFVQHHFRYPGCWTTNRAAFGLDLLRAPLNLLWAPLYVCLMLAGLLAGVLGFARISKFVQRLPGGFTTNVQKQINQRIYCELLDMESLRRSIEKRIHEVTDPGENSGLSHTQNLQQRSQQLSRIVDEALQQLMQTRTATADITNTLFTTAVGALAFKKFTPGGIGIGILLTALWIEARARDDFFLGSTLGHVYYSLFPPRATWQENGVGILIVMLLLAIIASFSGLLTDPLQARLGIHQRRLRKLFNQLETDLLENQANRFKTLDPYIARILELFDTVKTQINL